MAAKRSKLAIPTCCYCGISPGKESDHVPARGFFPKPRPTNDKFIRVPTCGRCNRGTWIDGGSPISEDEEYVRSTMIAEWHAGNHPAAIALLNNEVTRSVAKRPNLGRTFYRNIHHRNMRLDNEIVVPDVGAFELDWNRVRRVLEKIVRGLFYHEMGKRLPDDHEVVVEILTMAGVGNSPKWNDPAMQVLLAETRLNSPRRIGDGVFSYAWHASSDTSDSSVVAVLGFYDGVYFVVAVRPKNLKLNI
jgi:hypothetical protein